MQILASDYDGTLKQYDDKACEPVVADRDKRAIEEFQKAGNLFGIVTGRSLGMIRGELCRYKLYPDFLIGQNGAALWDQEGRLLYAAEIETETVMQLVDYMKEESPLLFGAADLESAGILRSSIPNDEGNIENFRICWITEKELIGMQVLSFFIKMPSEQEGEELAARLTARLGDRLEFHCNKEMIDVSAAGVSKETGVRRLQKIYHPDRLAVIGDALNDLSMIRAFNGFYIEGGHMELSKYAQRGFANISECLHYMLEDGNESES